MLLTFHVFSAFGQEMPVLPVSTPETDLLEGQIFNPRISPGDPGLIAYERQVGDIHEVYLLNQLSSTVQRISPAGSMEQQGDFLSGLTGGETVASRSDGYFDWRPVRDREGRQWFAFVSSALGAGLELDLYFSYVDADGNLATEPAIRIARDTGSWFPRWSPDGDRLAFVSGGQQSSEIFLINRMSRLLERRDPALFLPVRLTNNPSGNSFPVWSPNGRFIAYEAVQREADGNNWGIHVLHVDDAQYGGDLQSIALTRNEDLAQRDERKPSWSPDGRFIAYYVSQAEYGAFDEDRLQDIDVVQPTFDDRSGRILDGEILRGSERFAVNVIPNDKSGPTWVSTSRSSDDPPASNLVYVRRDERAENPLMIGDVASWAVEGDAKATALSEWSGFDTRLHREPSVFGEDEAVRIAFVAFSGVVNRLEVRDLGGRPVPKKRQFQGSKGGGLLGSILVPGLGQYQKGQTAKALLFSVSELAALGTLWFSNVRLGEAIEDAEDARQRYLQQVSRRFEPADPRTETEYVEWTDAFSHVERVEKLRNAAAAAALGIYLLNVLDSALGRPAVHRRFRSLPDRLSGGAGMDWSGGGLSPALRLEIRFP